MKETLYLSTVSSWRVSKYLNEVGYYCCTLEIMLI